MEPGEQFGRYRLVERLGSGSMGEVWGAVLEGPHGFRKPVALKVLHEADGMASLELQREARLGGLVNHPNVVSCLELGSVDGRWFMTMERVAGISVSSLLKKGPLSPDAVLDLGVQVAAGLGHLHRLVVDGSPAPLLHRDIKPSNLMLDGTGLVRIVDLGIAAVLAAPGRPSGTLGYMAPEQHLGQDTVQSDLFSLGATLFVLATRRRPFGKGPGAKSRAENVEALLRSIQFQEPLEVIPGFAPILTRCLRFKPGDRYASAGELLDALAKLRLRFPGPGLSRYGTAESQPGGLISTRGFPSSVPPRPADLMGRSDELDVASEAVRSGPLSVSGLPGVGKTHLVQWMANAWDDKPIWWVSVRDCQNPDDVVRAISRQAGLVVPSSASTSWLMEALGGAAVVLDGVDGVLGLENWLEGLAGPTGWVVTCRKRLRLTGWRGLHLDPLPLKAATALYLKRCRDNPGTDLAEALVELVDRLPLAIELAASRTRHLTTERVIERMSDRFQVLKTRERGGTSLEAMIAESVSRLPEASRGVLDQLWVFEGGFELVQAEAVVRCDGWVLDHLEVLVDQSLVEADNAGFRLVRSIREFVRDRASGSAVRARHAEWFAQLGTLDAQRALYRKGGTARYEALLAAATDLHVAFDFAMEERPDLGPGLAMALLSLFRRTGPLLAGIDIVERALDAEHTPQSLARLLDEAAYLYDAAGDRERARALCETGLQAAAHASAPVSGHLLRRLAEFEPDDAKAEAYFAQARAVGETTGDGVLLGFIGYARLLRFQEGDPAEIMAWIVSSGSEVARGRMMSNLAILDAGSGHPDAVQKYKAALSVMRETGDTSARARTFNALGSWYLRRGELDDADTMFAQADRLCRRVGYGSLRTELILHRGAVQHLKGHLEAASELYLETLHRDPRNHHASLNLAQARLELGDAEGAWRRIQPVLGEGNPAFVVTSSALAARVALSLGRVDEARALAESTLLQADPRTMPYERCEALLARAFVAREEGEEASVWLRECKMLATNLKLSEDSEIGRNLLAFGADPL